MKTPMPWRHTFSMMEPFRREMAELFERFFGEEDGNGQAVQTWAPRVDVEETDKEFLVKADLPGVDPKDVEIHVVDRVLTLRGEKREEKEEKKKNYHRIERCYGRFYRAIPLPAGVDADRVAASSAKGVITIAIPKKPEMQPKKITVKPQD